VRQGAVLLALAAAACGQQSAGNAQAPANDVAAATPSPTPSASWTGPQLAGGSWDGLFAEPKAVLDIFARVGLRPGAYEKAGDRWRSVAIPTPMNDAFGPAPVMATFVASGDAKRIDRLEYGLIEPMRANDQQARDAFDKWLAGSLAQFGVTGGEAAVGAIHGTRAFIGHLRDGADYKVVRTTTDKDRRVTVIFTRSAPQPGQTNQGSI
jgi:hypothetical protein